MDRQSRAHAGGTAPAGAQGIADIEAAEFADYLRDERERRQGRDGSNWAGGMYRRAMMRAYAESIGVDPEIALSGGVAPAGSPLGAAAVPPRVEPPIPQPRGAEAAAQESRARESRAPEPVPPPPRPAAPIAPPSPVSASSPPVRRPRHRASAPPRRSVGLAAAALFAVATLTIWTLARGSSADDRGTAAAAGVSAAGVSASVPAPTRPDPPVARTPPPPAAALPVAPAAVRSDGGRVQEPAAARRRPAAARATAARAERALASEGTLSITSQPSGARVTVNGIGWGETPVTIRHLDFGPKRIRLTLQGYLSEERVAHLAPSQPSASARVYLRRRSR